VPVSRTSESRKCHSATDSGGETSDTRQRPREPSRGECYSIAAQSWAATPTKGEFCAAVGIVATKPQPVANPFAEALCAITTPDVRGARLQWLRHIYGSTSALFDRDNAYVSLNNCDLTGGVA
jgi:hypothetical protein